MRIVFQHLPADVACDGHKGLLASLALGQFGDARVPQIVESNLQARALQGRTPRRTPGLGREASMRSGSGCSRSMPAASHAGNK
jgi:hypothetical protein